MLAGHIAGVPGAHDRMILVGMTSRRPDVLDSTILVLEVLPWVNHTSLQTVARVIPAASDRI